MKILVAPNSFKESLNSKDVTRYIIKGLARASKQYRIAGVPLADGGIGTVHIITDIFDGEYVTCTMPGPYGNPVKAVYGLIPGQHVGVIELAQVAGIHLAPKKSRNPLIATTTGVGKLFMNALDRGYRKFIMGIGDSATIDCGIGALMEFGISFFDRTGRPIIPNCAGLLQLHTIDVSTLDPRLLRTKITIASDVKNILTGKNGAIIFARQKGAREKDLPVIRRALKRFKTIILRHCNTDVDKIPGSGAAGGIGGAFVSLLHAQIVSGSGLIQEMARLEEEIESSDLVITGEGRIDEQSFYGKTLKRVIDIAYIHKKPVILIAGSIARSTLLKKRYSIKAHYSLSRISGSKKKALAKTGELLEKIGYKIGQEIKQHM